VEKDLLQKVLQNYPSSTADDAEKLRAIKEAYPYSQVLHVLAARVSKEHAFAGQQNELQIAAVYSADRGVLKHMMTNNGGDAMPASEVSVSASNIRVTPVVHRLDPLAKESAAVVPQEAPVDLGGDDLAEQVIKDVNELYKTRHNFEKMFIDNPVRHLAASVRPGDETIKSKRERIIEMSKALNAQPMKEGEAPAGKRRRLERKDIIDEIAHTKHEIEPEDPKQKEQLEIIEHFIQTQPSISNSKDKPLQIQDGDLSSIKTGEFGDNIVSETLVELLLKQGKKDKAIEVLKKLIWKFPQKKTYFAAQIEELKK
jgi:hypothetical protein